MMSGKVPLWRLQRFDIFVSNTCKAVPSLRMRLNHQQVSSENPLDILDILEYEGHSVAVLRSSTAAVCRSQQTSCIFRMSFLWMTGDGLYSSSFEASRVSFVTSTPSLARWLHITEISRCVVYFDAALPFVADLAEFGVISF